MKFVIYIFTVSVYLFLSIFFLPAISITREKLNIPESPLYDCWTSLCATSFHSITFHSLSLVQFSLHPSLNVSVFIAGSNPLRLPRASFSKVPLEGTKCHIKARMTLLYGILRLSTVCPPPPSSPSPSPPPPQQFIGRYTKL